MSDDKLHYSAMVDDALRSVVTRALEQVAQQGLPGEHHFYLTFKTWFNGVQIPEHLRAKFDDEMTIVLQHQFENLYVEDGNIYVTLSFNGKNEPLIIPLNSLTGFFDPSVQFSLQFKVDDSDHKAKTEDENAPALPVSQDTSAGADGTRDAGDMADGEDASNVVALDTFRKK